MTGELFPWQVITSPELRNLDQEVVDITVQCLTNRMWRNTETIEFIDELYKYDIPLAQSPGTRGDSLLKLLETSRNFCIAPLVTGGADGLIQLKEGHLVAAMLTTGTAGVMTLILISTVSVASLLVDWVAKARSSNKTPTEPQRKEEDKS